jgi:hypothetical protein
MILEADIFGRKFSGCISDYWVHGCIWNSFYQGVEETCERKTRMHTTISALLSSVLRVPLPKRSSLIHNLILKYPAPHLTALFLLLLLSFFYFFLQIA